MIMQQDVDRALRSLHDDTFNDTEIARRFSRDAFISSVSAAFARHGDAEAADLRDLIFSSEIDAIQGRVETAKARGIGLRTLYRRRRAALRVICDYLNERLALDVTHAEPLDILRASAAAAGAPSYNEAFKAHSSAHARHRMAGEIALLEDNVTLAVRLRWTLSPLEAIELKVMQVETAIVKGELSSATTLLRQTYSTLHHHSDRRLAQRAVLAEAQTAFYAGHHEQAARLADELASAASTGDAVWAQINALCGRIAALRGERWMPPSTGHLSEPDAFCLRAIAARHLLLRGSYGEAESESRAVFEFARRSGLLPLAAYAAATLALCYGSFAPDSRDSWAMAALKMLAACASSCEVAYDLFRLGTLANSMPWLSNASEKDLADIYLCLQPASHLAAYPAFKPFVEKLVGAIVKQGVAAEHLAESSMDDLVESAWDAARTLDSAAAVARELETLTGLGEFLKVVWPLEQVPRYAARFNSTARTTVRAVTRALTHRQIRALSHVS